MNRTLLMIGLGAGLALGMANAAAVTWSFGSPGTNFLNGSSAAMFKSSGGTGTITAYGFQETDSTGALSASGYLKNGTTSTLTGLFSVTAGTGGNIATGIGPYDPYEGGSPYTGQQGIAEPVDGNIVYENILMLKLGSDIGKDTVINFLMQQGDQAADFFNVYHIDSSSLPTALGASWTTTGTAIAVGGISTSSHYNAATTSQFSIKKDTALDEYVAITADCTYMVLDSAATDSNGIIPGGQGTPEPRFYGLLLVSLLAIPAVRRRFVPQQ